MNNDQEKTRAQRIAEQSEKLKSKLNSDLDKLEAQKAAQFKQFQKANDLDAARLKAQTEVVTGKKISASEALKQVMERQDVSTGPRLKQPQAQVKTTSTQSTSGVKNASGQQQQASGANTAGAIAAGAQGVSQLVSASAGSEGAVGETNTGASVGSGVAVGAGTGAAAGSLAGPVGTVVGAAVGAVVGGVTGALKASSNRKKARIMMQNRKLKQIAAIEGEKEDRIQNAIAGMGARMSNALRVPTVRF